MWRRILIFAKALIYGAKGVIIIYSIIISEDLMANYRRGRINDEMQKELALILREIKDPRIKDAFISITAVEATGDLKFAKVYYSAMLGDKKEVAKGLKSSAGFIRRQLAMRLNLRMTPELSFYEDHSIEHGAKISKLLEGIEISEPEDEQNDD